MNTEGIVLLGFPRSGTTLVRRLLSAHSRLSCPGETHLLSACARFRQAHRVVDGLEVSVATALRLLEVPDEMATDHLRRLVRDVHRAYAARSGKPRWIEKTATDVFHLDAIESLFDDELTYLFVTRHGLDVCCSVQEWCQRMEAFPPELHEYVRQFAQPLVAIAHAWVDVMASVRLFTERRAGNGLVVSYERLVADPARELGRVLEFLGEAWEPGLLERAQTAKQIDGFGDWKSLGRNSIDSSSVGRWRRLARGTIAQLAPIVNPTLALYGYDEVPVSESLDRDESVRRYELALRLQVAHRPEGDAQGTNVSS